MAKAVLELRTLSVGYRGPRKSRHLVAAGIDLSLRAGELVCLLGPNGAGKSTLLRTAAAMQAPLGGEVLLDGRNIHGVPKPELARVLSVVLTERVTAGLLTSYDVVALGRSPYTGWSGALREKDHAIVEESIRAVDATHHAHRFIGELSDGERQKIMLARALAQQPKIMILDEITAFLDLPRRVEIMQILRRLTHEHGRAVLLSTHDLELALSGADRVWLLPKGGSLIAGAPEDLVLQGHFATVFASEGIHFDEEAGSFSIRRTFRGDVALEGDGVLGEWTRRALERGGYRVSAAGRTTVTARHVDNQSCWRLSLDGCVEEHLSIESLLDALRAEGSQGVQTKTCG